MKGGPEDVERSVCMTRRYFTEAVEFAGAEADQQLEAWVNAVEEVEEAEQVGTSSTETEESFVEDFE